MAGNPFPSSCCLQTKEDVSDGQQGHAAGAPCLLGPSRVAGRALRAGSGLRNAEDSGAWAEVATGGNIGLGEEQKNW